MADPTTVNRVEPTLGPTPAAASTASVEELRAAVQSAPPSPVEAPPSARADRPGSDQLSRIEDKADRIDEKYARTETLMQRVQDKVEAVTGQISKAALQSDLVIMRDRVEEAVRGLGRLPGLISLVFTAIVTALLAAALTVAAIKYFPGTPM